MTHETKKNGFPLGILVYLLVIATEVLQRNQKLKRCVRLDLNELYT